MLIMEKERYIFFIQCYLLTWFTYLFVSQVDLLVDQQLVRVPGHFLSLTIDRLVTTMTLLSSHIFRS